MNCISMSNINCAALKCPSKINVLFENARPAALRGASREAGVSLEHKNYPENEDKKKNKNKTMNKNKFKNNDKNQNKISSTEIQIISEHYLFV